MGSVQTTLSAVNFIQSDIFQDFWISRMMLGFKKRHVPTLDTRQPLTAANLDQLCSAAGGIQRDSPESILKQAMFLFYVEF